MAETAIPVDPANPGQVFGCMGFLEGADALCGGAEGWFDWRTADEPLFRLRVGGPRNPFAVVLDFVAAARAEALAPCGWAPKKRKKKASRQCYARTPQEFPGPPPDSDAALPVRLADSTGRSIILTNWMDGSSRDCFKLYAGNRSALKIMGYMINGDAKRRTKGIAWLSKNRGKELLDRPFDALTPMGGSFNFDPRGGWKAIEVGYSPNVQKQFVESSPVVELMAAWGLEHARPNRRTQAVRYSIWGSALPPILARAALAGCIDLDPLRRFGFRLDASSQGDKVVTYAQEEPQP